MKFLVAVVLLACAATASADYYKPKYVPAPPPSPKPSPPACPTCKDSYQLCKDVIVQQQVCKPVYTPVVKPVYGRKLSNDYKPVYNPAPAPTVCKLVNVTTQQCTAAPCTVTTYQNQTTCNLVCASPAVKPVYTPAPASGRKLSNAYKPLYVQPVVVKPSCQNVCTTKVVEVSTCLAQCVVPCPSPTPSLKPPSPPAPKPVYTFLTKLASSSSSSSASSSSMASSGAAFNVASAVVKALEG